MRVHFVTKGKDDPAARYRATPVRLRLEELGYQTSVHDAANGIIGKIGLLSDVKKSDLVFIQRKLFSPWFVRYIRRSCRHLVFDFDDAIFSKSNGDASPGRLARFRQMITSSDLVLAGNTYLADYCRNLFSAAQSSAAPVEVVPTPVDENIYRPVREKSDDCILVWIGSRSTRKYLESHRETFEAIGQKCPDVSLRIISDFEFSLDNMPVENIPWSSESEAVHLASAQIGIAPMIDNPYSRGKCALKIIQYMAAGLPVISSDVGANHDVVVQGQTGFLANSTHRWIKAVQALAGDSALRDQMGSSGRERMVEHYSQTAVVDRVVGILTDNQFLVPPG